MVIIYFGQTTKFKIIYNNIPHTPSNVGVVVSITFSFTLDEAMSVGLVKACVRRIKSILFIEKSSALVKLCQKRVNFLVYIVLIL